MKFVTNNCRSDYSKCLRNEPTVINSSYPKILPGRVADLDAQCDGYWPGSKSYHKEVSGKQFIMTEDN